MSKAETLTPLQQELLNRADAIFKSIGDAVNQAATFAGEQIPDIAFQYVAWGRAYLSIMMVIALIVLAVGLVLAIRIGFFNSRKLPDNYESWHGGRLVAIFAGFWISFIGFVVTMNHLSSFLMVWFAPKIWLMQEIVNLIKR